MTPQAEYNYQRGMDEDYDDLDYIENKEELDDYINSRGGIDKCMCCGKYKYADELTKDQVCIKPCRNSNEY